MQITSNTYTNYTQQSSTKNTEEIKGASFASMLTTHEETIKDSKVEETAGDYVSYLDGYGAFDSLSEENKTLFTKILNDDEVTMSEIDSLSYEQASLFVNYIHPPGNLTSEEIGKSPLLGTTNQIGQMLFTTKTTNDDTFNEALYRTAREIDDDDTRRDIINEVRVNTSQIYFGKELSASYINGAYTDLPNMWVEDIANMNIDFDKFLEDVNNLHEEAVNNPKMSMNIRERSQEFLDGYNLISKHFYDIQSEISEYA